MRSSPRSRIFSLSAPDAGVDAFILTDLGVLEMAKRYAPKVAVHISTQAGIVNYAAANAFYSMGAERVVLARELSLSEIAEIRAKTPPELEIEAFVHGAMCVSFSGRCLLSNYLTGAGREPRRLRAALPLGLLSHRAHAPGPALRDPAGAEKRLYSELEGHVP